MDTAEITPQFPPLFQGERVGADAFAAARTRARQGCDSGTVTWCLRGGKLEAAIVFAPEVPLSQAAQMLPLCGVGLHNALGALAPPEVAIHLDWAGPIRVNGGICGALSVAASDTPTDAIPDWLAVGLTMPFLPSTESGGDAPDHTALYSEGCGDLDPITLLEAWTRHTLVWLNRWSDDGIVPLLNDWTALAHGLNTDISVNGQTGLFLGVDEHFAMLLKTETTTQMLPLTELLRHD